MHTCDVRYRVGDTTNRRCCNPAHLKLGTPSQNTLDRHAKGRTARGDRHGWHLHPECIPRGKRMKTCVDGATGMEATA